jgi:ketosteroid isomerase-like protein
MNNTVAESSVNLVGFSSHCARRLVMGVAVLTALCVSLDTLCAQESEVVDSPTQRARSVLAFERRVEAAVLSANVEFLAQACGSDFTYTHGDGWTTGGAVRGVDTKSAWLASLPGRYTRRDVDGQSAEVHGDVAITMGRVRARIVGADGAERAFSFRYIRVYAYRDGQWEYLSHRTVHGPTYEG